MYVKSRQGQKRPSRQSKPTPQKSSCFQNPSEINLGKKRLGVCAGVFRDKRDFFISWTPG
jgi:hypothetical protein